MLAKADKEKDTARARAIVRQSMSTLRSTSEAAKDRGGRLVLAAQCKQWSTSFSQETCMGTVTNPAGH